MTNRIDHTGHDHPNTPAARAKCRKAARTTDTGRDYVADHIRNQVAAHAIKAKMDRRYAENTPMTRDEAVAAYWKMPIMERTRYGFEHTISELMIGRPGSECTITASHCENCGSTDYDSVNNGDQGYSACCNEIVAFDNTFCRNHHG